jgi:hypothetical protein
MRERPVDFHAVLKPVNFARRQPAQDIPAPLRMRHRPNRRIAALRECREILAELPEPGFALHCIQSGRFDLSDLIDVMLERLGQITHMRIATLSFNGRNTQRMAAWVQGGTVERLSLLASQFFTHHYPALFLQVQGLFPPPHAVAASRNHAKIICFDCASGAKLSLEGSANLRTNSNREQFCLIHDASLHDWHAAHIDAQVSQHAEE